MINLWLVILNIICISIDYSNGNYKLAIFNGFVCGGCLAIGIIELAKEN